MSRLGAGVGAGVGGVVGAIAGAAAAVAIEGGYERVSRNEDALLGMIGMLVGGIVGATVGAGVELPKPQAGVNGVLEVRFL